MRSAQISQFIKTGSEIPKTAHEFVSIGLLVAVLWYILIGGIPFSGSKNNEFLDPADRDISSVGESGSSRNQIVLIIFAVIALYVILSKWSAGRTIISQNHPLVFLILWCGLSVLWASHPAISIRRVILLIIVVTVITGVVVGMQSHNVYHRAAILVSGTTMGLNVLAAFFFPDIGRDSDGLFLGMHGHKNKAGLVAAISVFIWISAARGSPRRLWRGALYGGAVIWLIFLVGTNSKTSLGLVPITILVVTTLRIGLRCYPFNEIPIVVVFIGNFVVWTVFAFFLYGIGVRELLGNLSIDSSFTGRTEVWSFVMDEIWKNPWLGSGFGSFWAVGSEGVGIREGQGFITKIVQGHNGYLDISVTIGLVGLFIFCYVLIVAFLRGIERSKVQSSRTDSASVVRTVELAWYFFIFGILHNFMESSFLTGYRLVWVMFLWAVFVLMFQAPPGMIEAGHDKKTDELAGE